MLSKKGLGWSVKQPIDVFRSNLPSVPIHALYEDKWSMFFGLASLLSVFSNEIQIKLSVQPIEVEIVPTWSSPQIGPGS